MRKFLNISAGLAILFSVSTPLFSQSDCNVSVPACNLPNFTTNSSGPGAVNDIPAGNNISNPSINPGTAGNSGCLFSNELNPTWLVFSVSGNGPLTFSLGGNGGGGFYDWAMWPYTSAASCQGIQNNTLAPVACNWNSSSSGFTGMAVPGNLPPGASPGNFENAINVVAGQSYVLMFSNFSGLVGANVPIATSPNVQCSPFVPNYTVCLGTPAEIGRA